MVSLDLCIINQVNPFHTLEGEMSDRRQFELKLYKLLSQMEFAERYYRFFQQTQRNYQGEASFEQEDFADALSSTGVDFKYDKRERFFGHKESHPSCDLTLNVAFLDDSVEFILAVKTSQGYIGGPFTVLARQVKRLGTPDFDYSPRSPKPQFSNAEQLQDVVNFGVLLFKDAKRVILSAGGWDS
jgi:hypothetical protein